jgi:Tfp pilus assembly PilM family ATPase
VFRKQAVAIRLGETVSRAVWIRGAPGAYEVVRAVEVTAPPEESLAALMGKLRSERVPAAGIVLGVPGRAATLRYHRMPPVPDWRLQLILKYETEEMVERSGEPLSSDFLALETPESAGDEEVHLLGMGKEHELVPWIAEIEAGGGRARQAIPSALGGIHAYLASERQAPEETVAIVDVGDAESHLGIVRDGRLLFARTVTTGIGELDELIGRRLDIGLEEARRVRELATEGRLPPELEDGVQAVLRSWGGQLGQLVGSSVSFCRNQTRIPDLELDRLLLGGSGATLVGRTTLVGDSVPARIEPLRMKIAGEALPGPEEVWAPTLGLAAAGVDPRQRILDLLPASFVARRTFRERTRFLLGAAAALLLAVGVQGIAGSVERGRGEEVQRTVDRWRGQIASWRQAEAGARAANEKLELRDRRLRDERETGTFHLRVLDELGRAIPGAIRLASVRTARVSNESAIGVEVVVSGTSDNSDGRGIDHMEHLRDQFLRVPGVRRCEIEPGDLEEGGYPFTLTISPDETMPEKQKRETRPGRFGAGSRGGF